MRYFKVEYLGFATVDLYLSNPMIPWIVSEIKKRGKSKQVSVRDTKPSTLRQVILPIH